MKSGSIEFDEFDSSCDSRGLAGTEPEVPEQVSQQPEKSSQSKFRTGSEPAPTAPSRLLHLRAARAGHCSGGDGPRLSSRSHDREALGRLTASVAAVISRGAEAVSTDPIKRDRPRRPINAQRSPWPTCESSPIRETRTRNGRWACATITERTFRTMTRRPCSGSSAPPNKGMLTAQATLGAYYWAGRGVPEDLSKAYFWSAIALAQGDENSKSRLEGLASQMTQAQVSAARQQAEVWIRTHSTTREIRRRTEPSPKATSTRRSFGSVLRDPASVRSNALSACVKQLRQSSTQPRPQTAVE